MPIYEASKWHIKLGLLLQYTSSSNSNTIIAEITSYLFVTKDLMVINKLLSHEVCSSTTPSCET
jgi:hypothetical protein